MLGKNAESLSTFVADYHEVSIFMMGSGIIQCLEQVFHLGVILCLSVFHFGCDIMSVNVLVKGEKSDGFILNTAE